MDDLSTHNFIWSWQGKDLALAYDVRGRGEPVVLLPAFSTVSTREEMARLAQRLSVSFRTIVPDWPGFGRGAQQRLDHSPRLHLAFLRAFCAQVVCHPAMVVAAGHAGGYAMACPELWTKIALIAPTWRGPLPTMMGGTRKLQQRVRAAIALPVLGPALYRLNVAAPVIAMMYRRHVFADAGRITPAFVADKAAIARRPGGRFGSGAFVTGALDLVPDRAAFLALVPDLPIFLIYGADTPAKSFAEMEALATARPDVIHVRLNAGSLGLHEEAPEMLADKLLEFLRSPTGTPTEGVRPRA